MADHEFVDYWEGDSPGRSENCAHFSNGRFDCGKPYFQHPGATETLEEWERRRQAEAKR